MTAQEFVVGHQVKPGFKTVQFPQLSLAAQQLGIATQAFFMGHQV